MIRLVGDGESFQPFGDDMPWDTDLFQGRFFSSLHSHLSPLFWSLGNSKVLKSSCLAMEMGRKSGSSAESTFWAR